MGSGKLVLMSDLVVRCYLSSSFVIVDGSFTELRQIRSLAVAWQAVGGVADASSV